MSETLDRYLLRLIPRIACVVALASGGIAWGTTDAERTVVFQSGADGYHSFRIPAVIRAANGDLVALCEGRKNGGGDAGDIDVVSRRSMDGGRTWGPLQIVWDDGPHTCGNPCPVVDGATGAIWLPLTHNLGHDGEKEIEESAAEGSRTVWMCKSDDHGATWSTPIEITDAVKAKDWTWYATGPGAGIQIQAGPHRGRLVIPCDHREGKSRRRGSHVIYSDDHGGAWQLGAPAPRGEVNECEVVELADSRLMLNMRNYDRSVPARQIALSDDGGQTWKDQRHDPALVEPVCQASIRRVRWPSAGSPGLILFANPASVDSRSRLTVRGSLDDGQTWPYQRLLYAESSAYSCLVALDESTAGCLFEIDNYGKIVFARFPLDWIESSKESGGELGQRGD